MAGDDRGPTHDFVFVLACYGLECEALRAERELKAHDFGRPRRAALNPGYQTGHCAAGDQDCEPRGGEDYSVCGLRSIESFPHQYL